MKKDKQDRMFELIQELQELLPELSNIATDSLENPGFIMIADEENFNSFALMLSELDIEARKTTVEDELEKALEGEFSSLLGFDDDDDKGPLQ